MCNTVCFLQNTSLLRASVVSLRQRLDNNYGSVVFIYGNTPILSLHSLQAVDNYLGSDTELDYPKIKTELVGSASSSTKAHLLQALRWVHIIANIFVALSFYKI